MRGPDHIGLRITSSVPLQLRWFSHPTQSATVKCVLPAVTTHIYQLVQLYTCLGDVDIFDTYPYMIFRKAFLFTCVYSMIGDSCTLLMIKKKKNLSLLPACVELSTKKSTLIKAYRYVNPSLEVSSEKAFQMFAIFARITQLWDWKFYLTILPCQKSLFDFKSESF